MTGPIVSIRAVSKIFGAFTAVDDVSLDIAEGEFFALLGPSGCGKTTLLRMVSGFETPSRGQVLIGGADMTTTPPNRRPVNMVFQSYAVFPHMTVAKNVAYGLKVDGVPAASIGPRVEEALALVQLSQLAGRKPDQLSGGQRQRVALARALVKKPRVLLLDEPLSALDAKLRDEMRLELVKLQQTTGVSFIMVTHDQDEAMAVADRIAVLHQGRIRQIASPEALYRNPVDSFVAGFIGKVNFFEARRVRRAGAGAVVETAELPPLTFSSVPEGDMTLAIRPEKLRLGPDASGEIRIEARLGDVAFQGESSSVELFLPCGRAILASVHGKVAALVGKVEEGASIAVAWDAADMLVLPKG
ncbi:ABC transporter ATP-binding protein [Pikeienuella sp. HZG-20]|uniref:ABC transporter ATP-binding protein n=1 Tax=Paludibacillus litoralis TaxID=3133267 RepID=UPI0030EDCD6A